MAASFCPTLGLKFGICQTLELKRQPSLFCLNFQSNKLTGDNIVPGTPPYGQYYGTIVEP